MGTSGASYVTRAETMMTIRTLLFLLACLCHHVQHTHALSCVAITGQTCASSLYITDECLASSVCECKANAVPSKYGCQEPIVTEVSIKRKGWNDDYERGEIRLACKPSHELGTYKWFKDGKQLSGQNTDIYRIKAFKDDKDPGSYTCSMSINEMQTNQSQPFELKSYYNSLENADLWKPVVSGVPTKVLLTQTFKIFCLVNAPYNPDPSYTITIGSKQINGKYGYESHTVKRGDSGQITCSYKDSPTSKAIVSDSVPFPTIANKIHSVRISTQTPNFILGKSGVLTCDIDGIGFPGDGAMYKWTKDGKRIGGQTGVSYVINSVDEGSQGVYTCTANFMPLELPDSPPSPPFTLSTVAMTTKVYPSTTLPLLKSYATIRCRLENALWQDVSYKWQKDGETIPGFSDPLLQINDIGADDTKFQCISILDGQEIWGSSIVFTSGAVNLDNTITPTIKSNKDTKNFIKSANYTLRCDSDYKTPGMTYMWTIDGALDNTKTSSTIEVTVGDSSVIYTCKAVFNGASTNAGTLRIAGKGLGGVEILYLGKRETSLSVFRGSTVPLTCKSDVTSEAQPGPVSYKWTVEGETVSNTEQYNFTAKSTNITCTASKDGEVEITSITATGVDEIEKPTLTLHYNQSLLPMMFSANFSLKCLTSTFGSGMRSILYRNNKIVQTEDSVIAGEYHFTTVASALTSEYSCTVHLGDVTSETSDIVEINVVVGKPCMLSTSLTDCQGESYNGTCTERRCNCADGFFAFQDSCALMGKPCTPSTSQTDCQGKGYTGTCTNQRCACANGFVALVDSCTEKAVGKPCTPSTSQTDCQGTGYTGTCTNQRCACAEGFVASEDSCASNAMKCVTSVLLVLFALMLTRMS